MPRLRFRTRIFIAMGGLVGLAIALILALLQDATVRRVREDFGERFQRTAATFRRLQALRTESVTDEVAELVQGNPQLRTVLSMASLARTDLGFAEPPRNGEASRDANLRLESILSSLAIQRNNDVVVVANAQGELLYSKVDPQRFGDDISALGAFRSVASGAETLDAWTADMRTHEGSALTPENPPHAVYEIVGAPVVFDDELHGVMIVGHRIDADTLSRIRNTSGVEVALIASTTVVGSTLDARQEAALAHRLAEGSASETAASRGEPTEWRLGEGRYLVMPTPLVGGLGPGGPRFLLLSSLDRESMLLAALREALLLIAGLVLLVALGTSFFLARSITQPLAALAQAARRVGTGQLDTKVELATGDEFEEVGQEFNMMVSGLRERDAIRTMLERHVSKEVAAELLRDPAKTTLAGVRRELSVMFIDIAGFTALAERLPPEEVVSRLNEYFDCACGVILEAGGTVSEFQGDGIVAFFGAPIAHADHAARACRAALLCRERLAKLESSWASQRLPIHGFRIGIHTAELVVGEIGSAERGKYGAVGDGINVASRIEAANKLYDTRVLISEATLARAGDAFVARELDLLRLVGREEPVRVFELVAMRESLDPGSARLCELFRAALTAYRARDFASAKRWLEEAAAFAPGDGPVQHFLLRVARFQAEPPAPDWLGVWELSEK